jgi:hypothetical protein
MQSQLELAFWAHFTAPLGRPVRSAVAWSFVVVHHDEWLRFTHDQV